MASPTPSTAGFFGASVFSVLAAMLGVGAITASAYSLTQGLLPFGGTFWLGAIVALVLGLIAYRRPSANG
jgi:predicted exporter